MKKTNFKKALSVFLSVLMLMSCWVWVAPTETEAIATDSTYAKADKYGTPAYTTANTYYVYFANGGNKLWVYFPTQIHLDVSETLQSAGYKINVKYEMGSNSAYKVLLGGPIWGDYLDASGKPSAYYTMTNIFDGYTVDASIPNGGSSSNVSIDKRGTGDGFTINSQRHETYVKFAATSSGPPNTANIYLMGTPKSSYKGTTSTFNTSGASVGSYGMGQNGSNGQDKGITGMVDGKWGQNDGNYMVGGWAEMYWTVTIYDKSTLNATINEADNIINNLSYKYTTASVNSLKTALNNNRGVLTTRATTQSNIDTANTNIRNAINGLKRTYDLTYENLFIYSDFINSESTSVDGGGASVSGSSIKYDYNAGTIKATTGGGEVFTRSNSSSSMYSVPVNVGTEYTLDYDVDYKGGVQTFVFFYNDAGQQVTVPGSSNYFYNSYDGKAITFTPPAGATKVGFRFGTYGNSGNYANYSNIRLYETSRQDIVNHAKAQGINRVVYAAGESIATNTVPTITRTGYTFNDWLVKDVDNNGDGKWDSVYDYDAGAYPMGASFVIYSDWTEHKYNIAFNANGGSGSTAGINNVLYSAEQKLTSNSFTRTGYTFNGWNTKDDGSGTPYADGTTVSKLSATNGATVTLYAQWKINSYTVTFEKANGTISTQTLVYGTTPSAPNNSAAVSNGESGHTTYTWPTLNSVTGDVTYKEIATTSTHDFGEWKTTVHSNCTTEGAKYRTCNTCGYREDGTIEKDAHTLVHVNAKAPSCTVDGTIEYWYCDNCAKMFSDADATTEITSIVDKSNGHTEVAIPAVPATCTTPGKTEGKQCSVCGTVTVAPQDTELAAHTEATREENRVNATCGADGSYVLVTYCSKCNTEIKRENKTIPATGEHTLGDWIIDTDATCVTPGSQHKECANCTYTETEAIPATGVHTPGAEATCTAPQTCTVCGAELAAQLDHTYEWVIDKEATCGAAGAKHEKCKNCDATRSLNTEIPATGNHTLGNWIIDTDATCVTPGSQHKECANCDYETTAEAIPATGVHNYTEFVETVAPTCTDKGYDIYKCATCDDKENKNYKDAAHTIAQGEAKEPTCGAAGWEAYEYCTQCDYTTKVEIPATGNHVYNYVQNADGKTHTGTCSCGATISGACAGGTATCENAAECTTCNTAYGEALGHDMQLTAEKVDPKCEVAGKEAVYTCANGCGKTTGGEEIPALVHNWVKGETTAPTCTARGYTTYTCSLCSSSKYADFVDELGHDWADATCTAPKTCSVCGATEGEALGHIYGETWTPSTENGKHYRDCTRCGEAARETVACTAGKAVEENRVEASCGADGSYDLVTYCTVCSAELSRGKNTIPATGKHNYVTEVEGTRVPATCTTEGEVTFECGCGATQVQTLPIDANNHEGYNTEVARVDSTCNTKGSVTMKCACGAEETSELELDKNNHEGYNTEVSRTPSTCSTKGSVTMKCACGAEETSELELDKNNHEGYNTEVSRTPSTCNTKGSVTMQCACGDTKASDLELDKNNHEGYNTEVSRTPSTCNTKGSVTMKCACGDTKTSELELDKNNHEGYNTEVSRTPSTCSTKGSVTMKCACGAEETSDLELDKNNHEGYNTEVSRTPSTCNTKGSVTMQCACGDTKTSDLELEASNHTNLVKTDANAATCENAGNIAYWTCEGCKKLYSDEAATTEITNTVIPAKGHDWNEGVVTTQPTCTTPGVKTFTCENDGSHTRTENVDINADAHSFGNWTQTKAPTCTAVGTEERVCAHNAAHKETRNVAIDANAHTGEANVIKNDKAATCTEEGYTGDTYWSCCKVLETKGTVIGKDANAHTTEETYVDGYVAPTCTTPGATGDTKYKCCNAVKAASTEIPALKHDYDTTKSEENLTRPVFENGAWTDGYYTYKCNNDNSHTTTEKVERADYTAYEAALSNLNALLATDITADAKAAINAAIEANQVADNLIASEQSSIDAKTAALVQAFEENKGSLQTYTVTFKIEGSADVVVTVISGQDATAPLNVKKDYDENNHYNFTGWDKAFTNVTSDLEVNAQFKTVAHSYTHTDKDDTYHTDKCDCGYSVDVEHTETSKVTTKASCFADGVRTYTCSVCSGTRTETIAKRTHNIVDTEVALAPTCSATGTMNQKCANEATDEYEACDHTTTRVIDIVADAHKAEAAYTVMQKATCEADGYKAILCEYCKSELKTETIVKRAHNYEDNGVQSVATCLNPGVMKTICENEETDTHTACAHESTREIAQLSHSYTGDDYKWNETNKTHSQKCVNGCNEYGNETNCTFKSVVTDPTCDLDGYTTYTCTVCNNSYDADYTTREHIYVYATGNGTHHEITCKYENCSYKATEACSGGTATCEAQAVCTKCNTAYGEKNADNHTNLVKTDAKTATCENAGNIAYWTCEGCNKLYSDEAATTEITNTVIPAKGHDWNEGVVTTQPTCTTPGVKTFTCENDGSHTRTENVDIDADAHSFGDWTQTKAPTCSAVGTEERVCAHNAAHKETRDVAISADAHSFGDWTQTKAPTCSAVGTEERVCAHNAAHKETRNVAIDVNAHTGTASVVKNASKATCKADGYTGDIYWSCCDKLSAKGSTIPALEHIDKNNDNLCDYNCGTEMNTCKHEGTPKQYITNLGENGKLNTHKIKCLACGQIVKIENCDFDTKVVAPSCYEEGYTKYTCKICTYSFVSDFEEKTEHDFGEWESNNATCHEIQSMSRRCKNTKCLYKETVKIIDENTGKYAYGAHSLVVVPGKDATCTKAGYTSYSICIHCEEVTGSKPIPAKGHADEDGDGNCDVCDSLMGSNGICGCFCHNDSFFGKIIFKIVNFFWKLFKINANCECGVKHW